MSQSINNEYQAVAKTLWDRFVAATKSHPRGMFFRVGDEGLKMKMLMASLSEVVTPLVLEVESLRRKVSKLQGEVNGDKIQSLD